MTLLSISVHRRYQLDRAIPVAVITVITVDASVALSGELCYGAMMARAEKASVTVAMWIEKCNQVRV